MTVGELQRKLAGLPPTFALRVSVDGTVVGLDDLVADPQYGFVLMPDGEKHDLLGAIGPDAKSIPECKR